MKTFILFFFTKALESGPVVFLNARSRSQSQKILRVRNRSRRLQKPKSESEIPECQQIFGSCWWSRSWCCRVPGGCLKICRKNPLPLPIFAKVIAPHCESSNNNNNKKHIKHICSSSPSPISRHSQRYGLAPHTPNILLRVYGCSGA